MTEKELRNKVLEIAKGWLGCKEANGTHKPIIDLYNSHKPLARSYKVKYTDHWCATYVSAVFIKAGLTDIAPTECSCNYMITAFKKLGRWQERDDYRPQIGDIILYDWDDSGKGDNTGSADHVGIVASVSGDTLKIIEGNMSEAVAYRTLKVNGRYIRGYCLPDYASRATKTPKVTKVTTEPAKAKSAALSGKYTVTADALNLRAGAGTNKDVIRQLPKGSVVTNYGFYTMNGSTKWLYVITSAGQIGYCSAAYLKRV